MKTSLKFTLVSGALLSGLIAGLNAAPDHRAHGDPGRPPERSPSLSVGVGLPSGSFEFAVGNDRFYENRGTFYRRGPEGFVVTRPPRGAVMPHLPPGCVRIYSGDVLYFRFGEIYYRQVPEGYVIVDAPVIERQPPVTTAETYQSVRIGDDEYLVKDGQFFRKTADGLVWQAAPLGAVTKTLPVDAKSIWHQDIEYFESDNVFFRKTPDGYRVVPAPWKS